MMRKLQRLAAIIILGVVLYTCQGITSGYKELEMECPTATNLLGEKIPAYQRMDREGIWIIEHCDGTIRLDTVKQPTKIK